MSVTTTLRAITDALLPKLAQEPIATGRGQRLVTPTLPVSGRVPVCLGGLGERESALRPNEGIGTGVTSPGTRGVGGEGVGGGG
jgi:hypothetical protein